MINYSKEDKEHIQYLLDKGWIRKNDDFIDPNNNGKYNEHSLSYAYKYQLQYDRVAKGLLIYFVRNNRYGYGYEIVAMEGVNKFKTARILGRVTNSKEMEQILSICNDLGHENVSFAKDGHNYQKFICFTEKYGDRNYYVPTLEELYKVCLAIVKERNKDSNWYIYEEDGSIKKPSLTLEQTNALPDGNVKNLALKEWKEYEDRLKENKGTLYEKKLLEQALAGNGSAAIEFLHERKNGEYEGFEIKEFDQF